MPNHHVASPHVARSRPAARTARHLIVVAAAPLALALAGCRTATRADVAGESPAAPCRPDTAVVARLQRLVDSVHAARPDARGVALHAIAPARCVARTFVAGTTGAPDGAPLVAGTPVRIASNTKPYVAAAVLRLVEEGRVALDDPIERHLSAEHLALLRQGGYDPAAITVRHLLTHTGGLFDHAQDEEGYIGAIRRDPARRWTRTDQLRHAVVRGRRLSPPGTAFSYSDTGYILLGELLERVTGRPLAAALRTLLDYDRLGLASTWLESLEPAPAGAPPRAHQWFGADDTFDWSPTIDLYGGGGLVATARDMAVFTRALHTGAVFRRPETRALLRTSPVTPAAGSRMRYGIGTMERTVAGTLVLGHSGFWGTVALHAPDADVTLATFVLHSGAARALATLEREALAALRDTTAARTP